VWPEFWFEKGLGEQWKGGIGHLSHALQKVWRCPPMGGDAAKAQRMKMRKEKPESSDQKRKSQGGCIVKGWAMVKKVNGVSCWGVTHVEKNK